MQTNDLSSVKTLILGMCLVALLVLITEVRIRRQREADSKRQANLTAQAALSMQKAARQLHSDQPRLQRQGRKSGMAVEKSPLDLVSVDIALADELVVKLKPGLTNIDALATSTDAQVAGRIDPLSVYRLRFTDADIATAARERLSTNPDVESLDSNYAIPRPTGGDEVGSGSEIQPRLTVTPGDSYGKLVIGLIDTAVQTENSGLDAGFFLPSISVAGDPSVDSSLPAHGTSMAQAVLQGLCAAETGNSETSVKILSVDVYGQSEMTSTYQVAEGIANLTSFYIQ